MGNLLVLIPVALGLGLIGLVAFLWSLRAHQFDDLDGAAARILDNDYEDDPLPDAGSERRFKGAASKGRSRRER